MVGMHMKYHPLLGKLCHTLNNEIAPIEVHSVEVLVAFGKVLLNLPKFVGHESSVVTAKRKRKRSLGVPAV